MSVLPIGRFVPAGLPFRLGGRAPRPDCESAIASPQTFFPIEFKMVNVGYLFASTNESCRESLWSLHQLFSSTEIRFMDRVKVQIESMITRAARI